MQAGTPIWAEAYKSWFRLNKWIADNSKGLNQGQKVELLNSIARYYTSFSFRRGKEAADAIHKKFYDELKGKNIQIKGNIHDRFNITVPNVPTDFVVQNGIFKYGEFYAVLAPERYKLLRTRGSDAQILLMLLEYAIYVSPGLNWQVPKSAYQYLIEKHGLTLEGCASPVNSQMLPLGGKYCSPSFFSDAIFGSVGSIFVTDIAGEVTLINPPFVEDFMEAVAIKIEATLTEQKKSTTIIFIGPQWLDAKFFTILAASPHLKSRYELAKGTYSYEDADSGKKIPARFNSTIFILSNVVSTPDMSSLIAYFK